MIPDHDTVARLGERALIDRLIARLGPRPDWLLVGAGDDAAVVAPGRGEVDVITTDALIEDVHFRRAWTSAAAIGRKALAVNLSDLAAMGATPHACLLSLALPPALPLADFDGLIDGLLAVAHDARVTLIGGNISRSSGPMMVDVTALGRAGRRRILTRAGGRPGHELYVTGSLGGAAAGLAMLEAGVDRAGASPQALACIQRYEAPVARLRMGRVVGRSGAASAAIDLSDGLAEAIRQLAGASTTGAIVDAAAVPVDPGARAWALTQGQDPLALAMGGGEDYELVFAVPTRRRRAFLGATRRCSSLPVTRIGQLTGERTLAVEADGKLTPLPAPAFRHF